MKKLFELSVRGSVYFYLSTISEEQMFKLKQFASQFYRSNPVYENKPDDEIAEYFILCGLPDGEKSLEEFRYRENGKKIVVLIDGKEKFLEHLDTFSINPAALFPEIECVAEYLKNKYTS